jgi:putative transcriptional regulator
MVQDPQRELAGAYALGSLPEPERAAFEAHLSTCPECAAEVAAHRRLLAALAPETPPPAGLRQRLLDLADAPRDPVDVHAYTWEEPMPGIHMCTLQEDPKRGVRKVLVWAKPGARYPSHRHLGEEQILVLQGALRDHRAIYRPGEVCRSAAGSVHSEEVEGSEDCVCFVVYYGGHEAVEERPRL